MSTQSYLSDRINNLSESATLKMTKLGRELAAKGVNVISLSVGEPDFNTPDHVKEAAKVALDENWTRYSPVPGYPELRQAIVNKLKIENNLDYDISQIVVSTGAKQSLSNVILTLINPGDEVIIPTPYWVSYSEMVVLAEGKSVFINTEIDNNFKITPEQLEAAITPKTKLFMFSSPNNPTGTVYSKDELAALAKVFEKYPQIFILSDEIYEHINFVDKHESIAQFDSIKDRVIIINGFSKAFAMTGWRLGYIACNKEIAAANDKLQGQTTSGTCSISQRAGIVAYEQGLASVNKMKEAFARRRQLVYDLLAAIPGVKTNLPEGAFYFFPEISSFFGKKDENGNIIKNSSDLALYLLNVGHVATVGGDSFGNDKYIRLSYAASDESLVEALKRIKEALGKLA
ncbi:MULTISPECIES: pyridoxal phosphate-dependent aminotransferase [Sphingobacterium]|jgi:aspartate aminotransferase|uniref:pyridoxal phosphate-dependent aminotransferase n=1 Tax=Sphingobacterium TaxID=28453 RepID=UPI00201030CF|nr:MULTISPECIES: pyridoxal phosphate-dependent aminotransferase [Sphingobacterium]UPZ36284.1 pyridoxal phosphate-dependent aminotransferase [Sphingobacterium sp. PCS056]UXD67887.1 pyridoxal phosphate-dependent aminotransferase [Sphingobacterium faecium]WGQ15517.1 pyridoxal phosphate-dependent aminotransferase [Sphingobacterium faecium]